MAIEMESKIRDQERVPPSSESHYTVRPARHEDVAKLSAMCHSLWPESSASVHAEDVASVVAGTIKSSLPAVILLAEDIDDEVVGFISVDLRSHADGCDPAIPVGYIEGWYVMPHCRRKQVGATLVIAAEQWARNQGCREMASDTWLDNFDSQRAHEALGYEVVDRCVHYRKNL